MTNPLQTKMVTAYQAQDTEDLLNHISWTDVLKPRLEQEKQRYQDMLVKSILSIEPTIKDTNGAIHRITREQLAGRVAGIDFVITLLENVLRKGQKAIEELKSQGITIGEI